MAIADQTGKPLSVYIESATPHEVKLVEKTLANRLVDELPEVLIGDKAYDSDELDQKLLDKYGIKLIAPNRKKRNKTQDGRELRRYRKRWKVERLFSWMQNFRHIRIRDDYYPENYLAMIYMAISIIFLRSIVRQPLEKIFNQIWKRILEILNDPDLSDSIKIGEKEDYVVLRNDVGEYRIIYYFDDTFVYFMLINKRNDGKVYKLYKQKNQIANYISVPFLKWHRNTIL